MANSDDGEKSSSGISSQEQNFSKSNSKMSGSGGGVGSSSGNDLGWQSSHRKLSKPNFLDLKRENHVDFLQTPDLNKVIISSPQLDSLVAQFPPTIPNLLTPALEVLPTMESVNNNNHNNNHNSSAHSNNLNNSNNNGPNFNNNNNNHNNNHNNTLNSNGLTFKSSLSLPDDDKMKLERKRERNRQAAAKCRNKKIQKITELEAKKAQLVKQRESLTENIAKYQEEIDALQRVLVERIKSSGVIDLTY